MHVVLQGHTVIPPLTGIGHYTRELGRALPATETVERLDVLSGWRCYTSIADAEVALAPAARARRLPGKALLGLAWRRLRSITAAMALPPGTDVFHSPDYELPRVSIPGVVTVHDLSHRFFPEHHPAARVRHLERVLPASLERADAIITVSDTVRNELISEMGIRPERVHAIANGARAAFRADCSPETAAQTYGLSPGQYVLSVGALEPRKNLARLLEAYLALPRPLQSAYPLILAGPDGWADRRLRAAVKRACDTGIVRRLGYVPDEKLPSLYSGAAAFVYPSVYEGFGLPVLEAMACGTPVITSATGALAEVTEAAALGVDVYDTLAIRDALEWVLTDRDVSARLRRAGPRQASGFTWSATAEATSEVYTQVLGGNRG